MGNLDEKIKKILESYNIPDSYLEHETNKWLSLISASHKELIERVRKEVIGSDEQQCPPDKKHNLEAGCGICQDVPVRNELRAEQRNLLSTIEKD